MLNPDVITVRLAFVTKSVPGVITSRLALPIHSEPLWHLRATMNRSLGATSGCMGEGAIVVSEDVCQYAV